MDYNLVKVGDNWLTDTGEETGMPCRTEVSGLDALRFSFTGSNTLAADGTPYSFIVENSGKGLLIEIRPFAITKEVLDDIVEDIEDAVAGNTPLVIVIGGDTGDFDLSCIPALPKPVEFPGTFSEGRIDGVVFRFLIIAVNEPEPEED